LAHQFYYLYAPHLRPVLNFYVAAIRKN
jgi:hypothetical protein